MNLELREKDLILTDITDFSVKETLECGQCFNFIEQEDKSYYVYAKGKILKIYQDEKEIIFYNTTKEDFYNIWCDYFDLNRNYAEIKRRILEKDKKLTSAINEKGGTRILNQDFFETLISFIISQNNRIQQIKKAVRNISERYGKCIYIDGKKEYIFPTLEELEVATEEELRECKVGFRGNYILNACKMLKSGEITEEKLKMLDYENAKKLLTKIKGVGDKVANCVLLFGIGKREAFPIDVWIKRIMETLYFEREVKKEEIEKFAKETYGELGGYAQQYMFFYGREQGIGKTK